MEPMPDTAWVAKNLKEMSKNIEEIQMLLFCQRNGATKWLLKAFSLSQISAFLSHHLGSFPLQLTGNKYRVTARHNGDWDTLEHSALERTSPINLCSQGSETLHKSQECKSHKEQKTPMRQSQANRIKAHMNSERFMACPACVYTRYSPRAEEVDTWPHP